MPPVRSERSAPSKHGASLSERQSAVRGEKITDIRSD